MSARFEVSLEDKQVSVYFEANKSVRSEPRGDHLESQVQQMKAKLLADYKESSRLTEILNSIQVSIEKSIAFKKGYVVPFNSDKKSVEQE